MFQGNQGTLAQNSPVQPIQQGRIVIATEKLARSIEVLEQITNLLVDRITPLCRPATPTTQPSNEKRCEPSSQMADALESFANRVTSCHEVISSKLSLLDF